MFIYSLSLYSLSLFGFPLIALATESFVPYSKLGFAFASGFWKSSFLYAPSASFSLLPKYPMAYCCNVSVSFFGTSLGRSTLKSLAAAIFFYKKPGTFSLLSASSLTFSGYLLPKSFPALPSADVFQSSFSGFGSPLLFCISLISSLTDLISCLISSLSVLNLS